jgi:hypothetical protein
MPTDTTLNAHAFSVCSTGPLGPILGTVVQGQQFRTGNANQFNGNHHRNVTPLVGMMMLVDTFIDSSSRTGMNTGGHAFEIRNTAGQTFVREVAQQANDSKYANVSVRRLAVGGSQVPVLDSGVLLVTIGCGVRNSYGARSN